MTDPSTFAAIARDTANRVFGGDVVVDVVIGDHYAGDNEDLLLFRLIVRSNAIESLDGDAILDANLAVHRAIQKAGETKRILVKQADDVRPLPAIRACGGLG